jgi:hypothetical protein
MARLPICSSVTSVDDSMCDQVSMCERGELSTAIYSEGQKWSWFETQASVWKCEDRQIEVKEVGGVRALNVLLMFENFLVWLLGLEPSRVG